MNLIEGWDHGRGVSPHFFRPKTVKRRTDPDAEMGVVEANHVIGKGDHSLTRETDATRGDAAVFGVGEATFFPMAVGVKNGGETAFAAAKRTVQISREV